jgi:hypothetical protein
VAFGENDGPQPVVTELSSIAENLLYPRAGLAPAFLPLRRITWALLRRFPREERELALAIEAFALFCFCSDQRCFLAHHLAFDVAK